MKRSCDKPLFNFKSIVFARPYPAASLPYVEPPLSIISSQLARRRASRRPSWTPLVELRETSELSIIAFADCEKIKSKKTSVFRTLSPKFCTALSLVSLLSAAIKYATLSLSTFWLEATTSAHVKNLFSFASESPFSPPFRI